MKFKKQVDFLMILLLSVICIGYIIINMGEKDSFAYRSDERAGNGQNHAVITGDYIEQYFVNEKDEFTGIELKFNKEPQTSGSIKITIESDGNVLVSDVLALEQYESGQAYNVLLDKRISGIKGRLFKLSISECNIQNGNLWTELTDTYADDNGLFINGELYQGVNINSRVIYRSYSFGWLGVLMAVISVILLTGALVCGEKDIPIEKSVLILLITLGAIYFFTLPMFRAPDEINHYMRAFEISQGKMISQHMGETGVGGNRLPADVIPPELCDARKIDFYKVFHNIDARIYDDRTADYTYGNTALYAPMVYLPQAAGIALARMVTNKTVLLAYAGRLTTFIFCILLLYQAVKNLRFGKLTYLLIIFMPMMMSQIVSLSADAVTNTIILLFVSYIIRYCYDDSIQRISGKTMVLLAVIMIELSLCKIVYLPICLLICLLPDRLFKSRKEAWLYKALSILSVAVINIIWLSISAGFLVEFNPGVNSKEQVIFVLTHLFDYCLIALKTLLTLGSGWLHEMVGSNLGWAMDVQIPKILISIFAFILIGSMVIDFNGENPVREKGNAVKRVTGIVALLVVMLIFTSLYVQWTPVGKHIIDGIQGRYFIPLLPLLLILLNNKLLVISKKINYKYIYLMVVFINLMAVIKQAFFYI